MTFLVTNRDSISEAGVFLARQLEMLLPKVYSKKYPALKFANGSMLPASAELDAGVDSVVEQLMSTTGNASDDSGDMIDDIPLADASVSEQKYPVVCKPIAIRYTVRELAAAQKGGRNIRGMREMAARRAIEESMNKLAAYGDAKRGIVGMLNDPNVPVVDSTTDLYSSATTPDALLEFLSNQVSKVVADSFQTEEPTTMAVPVRLYERISTRRVTDTNTTVLEFFLRNSPYISEIVPCNELSNAQMVANGALPSNSTKDAILIYPKNPEAVQRLYEGLVFLPPEIRGLHFLVIAYQCSTGAIWHYPKSALTITYPRFT